MIFFLSSCRTKYTIVLLFFPQWNAFNFSLTSISFANSCDHWIRILFTLISPRNHFDVISFMPKNLLRELFVYLSSKEKFHEKKLRARKLFILLEESLQTHWRKKQSRAHTLKQWLYHYRKRRRKNVLDNDSRDSCIISNW